MRKQVYQKRRARLRSLLIFCTAAGILLALFLRMDRMIRPELCAVCESETKRFTAGLMADSISEVLQQEQFQYSDFVTMTYDTSGNVTAVETKTDQINRLQAAIYQEVQEELEQCRDASLCVSLGTASGVWLFAGHGPQLSVRLLPVGHASVKLISALESAGVNQTCHTIRVEITAEVQAAIPFSKVTATAAYDCLLSETVIVGNVPDSYLEFGSADTQSENRNFRE